MYDWSFCEDVPEYHPIADANNLCDAFRAARKGSSWKMQVQKFRWNLLSEVSVLQKELDNLQHGRDGAYAPSRYSLFMVNERGKTRAITALSIRDRVVKHALNDLFLIPDIRPHLIYDNGASLKGKGVSFTRNRLVAHLEKFFRETGSNDGWIMTLDFSGYYDNIDHARANQLIRKYEPDEFARLLTAQAFDSYKVDVSYMSDEEYEAALHTKYSAVEYRKLGYPKEGRRFLYRSLSVGDQTSQITAVAFATPIDKLAKIVCGQKYYGRYMDDIYIIGKSLKDLRTVLERIRTMAAKLKLFINPRKTRISKLSRTFTFMQNKYYLRENGHVVVRINPKTLRRMRQKLKKLAKRVGVGLTRLVRVEEMFRSWIANYSPLMSKKQKENLVTLYQNLFGGGLDQWMKLRAIA